MVEIRKLFLAEFQLPQLEQQGITEIRDIKQRDVETAWEYMQRLKDALGKLTNPLHESHQREWYIQGLLPLTKIPLM